MGKPAHHSRQRTPGALRAESGMVSGAVDALAAKYGWRKSDVGNDQRIVAISAVLVRPCLFDASRSGQHLVPVTHCRSPNDRTRAAKANVKPEAKG